MCLLSFIFSLKFVGIVTISSSNYFITSPQIIAESTITLAKYFPFSQIHLLGFQTGFFSHTWIFLHSHRHLSLFHHWFELHFFPSKLHLYSHEMCFVNVLDLFIPVIKLKKPRFKSSVLLGIHILLDKSLIVLHLAKHLSNLTENG